MMPRYRDGRSLNDYLNPLRGFLLKSVGRPWDDVYSEVCKVADARSMQGNHLREHARGYVESYGEWSVKPYTSSRFFHVDESGLLQRNVTTVHASWNSPGDPVVAVDDMREYRQMNGIWYEILLADGSGMGGYVDEGHVRDAVTRSTVFVDPPKQSLPWIVPRGHLVGALYQHRWLYGLSKRQLDTRELASLGLQNVG
jgi:hypothetical protein